MSDNHDTPLGQIPVQITPIERIPVIIKIGPIESGTGGNAKAEHVLDGETFTNDDGEQIGTMPDRSGNSWPSSLTDGYSIAHRLYIKVDQYGFYGDNAFVYANDLNFDPKNWLDSKMIFGLQGTLPNMEGTTYDALNVDGGSTPGIIFMQPEKGYYPGVEGYAWIKKSDENWIAENIKSGVIIFGLKGSYEGSGGTGGNAQPSHVIEGETFTNDNGEQIGAMVNRTGTTVPAINLPVANGRISLVPPEGYYPGTNSTTVYRDEFNLIPSNIKKDVTILGVVGTLDSGGGGEPNSTVIWVNDFIDISFKSQVFDTPNNRWEARYSGTISTYVAPGTVDDVLIMGNIEIPYRPLGTNGNVLIGLSGSDFMRIGSDSATMFVTIEFDASTSKFEVVIQSKNQNDIWYTGQSKAPIILQIQYPKLVPFIW